MRPTADICDENEIAISNGMLQIMPSIFQCFGKKKDMAGKVITVKAIEDNTFVRKILEGEGLGQILIIDGAGSDRCALLGGNLACLAVENGWAGIIVYGSVRDAAELIQCEIGIWALSTSPRKSKKLNSGKPGTQINIGNIIINQGDYCLADSDGILISKILLE